MNLIHVYYHFDPVRGHPRFEELLRKMNFPRKN
jgi:hypothetical protein